MSPCRIIYSLLARHDAQSFLYDVSNMMIRQKEWYVNSSYICISTRKCVQYGPCPTRLKRSTPWLSPKIEVQIYQNSICTPRAKDACKADTNPLQKVHNVPRARFIGKHIEFHSQIFEVRLNLSITKVLEAYHIVAFKISGMIWSDRHTTTLIWESQSDSRCTIVILVAIFVVPSTSFLSCGSAKWYSQNNF